MRNLQSRIEKLETAAAGVELPGPVLTPAERALRLQAVLEDFLARGVLVEGPAGVITAGNLPEQGTERSLALLLLVIFDQPESEKVRIWEQQKPA